MKQLVFIINVALVVAMLVLSSGYMSEAASPPTPAKAEIDKMYELAKKEGEISVMKKAPHPNAAKLWAAWLLTPEAQELFEKVEYHSRLGVGSTSRQWKAIQDAKVEVWEFPTTREALDRQVALKEDLGKMFGAR